MKPLITETIEFFGNEYTVEYRQISAKDAILTQMQLGEDQSNLSLNYEIAVGLILKHVTKIDGVAPSRDLAEIIEEMPAFAVTTIASTMLQGRLMGKRPSKD